MKIAADQIKLIVFDVDGTLIDDNKDISPKTVSVLHEIQQKGVGISLATGKTFPSVEELVKVLNIKVPVILSNGGLSNSRTVKWFSQNFYPKMWSENF